ncbi:MAG: 2-oxoacid:acceptor oxidoreductase family protein [archaeon]
MKKFNLLIVGIGGEGVLTSGVVVARAAHEEDMYVTGLQLHGLSQRGGSIPVFVRFGSEVHAPTFGMGDADLIIATEPSEALRFAKYGNLEKTMFIIDDSVVKSPYSNVENEHYPSKEEIMRYLKPFSKKIYYIPISEECKKKFGDKIYGNIALLGVAVSLGALPLKEESMIKAIKETARRNLDKNMDAFKYGLEYGRKLNV